MEQKYSGNFKFLVEYNFLNWQMNNSVVCRESVRLNAMGKKLDKVGF